MESAIEYSVVTTSVRVDFSLKLESPEEITAFKNVCRWAEHVLYQNATSPESFENERKVIGMLLGIVTIIPPVSGESEQTKKI